MLCSVAVHHRTIYRYGAPVALGPQTVRLRPAAITRAAITAYTLTVEPTPARLIWRQDPAGNLVARVTFDAPADRLCFTVAFEAALGDVNPFDFVLEPDAAIWPFEYPALVSRELVAYRSPARIRPWLATLLQHMPLGQQPSVELLVGLNRLIAGRITYVTRMEPGVLTPEQTVDRGAGSCRDVAWLLVETARSLGFAARFVSGYLIQLVDPAAPLPGLAADKLDLHAWAEIYLPGAGWVGFDATSGLMAGAGHIPLAACAHPESAAPVSGTISASPAAQFDVETTVTRVSPADFAATLPMAGDRR